MKWKSHLNSLAQPLIAIFMGLLVGALAMIVLDEPIIDTYIQLWNGAFGSQYLFFSTLARTTPILLIGLGVGIAFRAGFFNLGGEGQMVLAAMSAALTALYMPGSGIVKLLAAIVVSFLVGGGWSVLAGWMQAKFKIQIVISTLLMNYIAVLLASYLASRPFQDRSGSAALAQTKMIDTAVWLPKLIQGMNIHFGFILAIFIALILFITFRYTAIGYEVNMLGKNPLFALYGGVKKTNVMLGSMLVSGGLAGFAGAFEVLGSHYRFIDGALTSPGYAWAGIMAALLAKSNPIGIIFTSLFLAALHTGSLGLERNTNVPMEIADVIQAVLILFITAKLSFSWFKMRKKEGDAHGTV